MRILLLILLITILSVSLQNEQLEIEEEQFLRSHRKRTPVVVKHHHPETVHEITQKIDTLREEKHDDKESPTIIQKKIDYLKEKKEKMISEEKQVPVAEKHKPEVEQKESESHKEEAKPVEKNNEISSNKNVLSSGEEGIDVSMYQGDIDWNEVKKQGHIKFAFIKATQGTSYIDPDFQRNWKGAGEAGVKRGAYCFFNSNEDGAAQAKFFIEHSHKGELPPVLDLETTNGMSASEVEIRALSWLNYVHEHLEKPILYTYSSFGEENLRESAFSKYPLWIADYGPSHPQIPSIWGGHYSVWQYGQTHVPGISGEVDKDISH